jgi:hypothetical protein
MHIHRIGDVTVLNDIIEVPGLGFLPVNAYVLHAEQPVVVDTGLSTADKDFVSAWLRCSIPPTCDGSGLLTRIATTPAVYGSSSKPCRRHGW